MENLVIDPDFWRTRSVLLTGHTGFKGGWLSLWLSELGASVSGYSLAPVEPSFYSTTDIQRTLSHQTLGDIRDRKLLMEVMQSISPEIVIHMAAQSLVGSGYHAPVDTFDTNVMGTVNLLEAVRSTPSVRSVLIVTSDKCYENENYRLAHKEGDPMGGYDPYSASKGCAELVSAAYRRSFLQLSGVSLATARAGNVIGGGDWAQGRIVPDAIRAFTNQQPLSVRNPHAVRPWQHVLEPLAGYLLLCQSQIQRPDQFSEEWNFGPDEQDTRPVSILADKLIEEWTAPASWVCDSSLHPHESDYLMLDSTKSNSQLNWSPVWNFEESIKKTVAWYRASISNTDMQAFSLNQIHEYLVQKAR
ncbi:MAG: CDP-glucose 4,6-dehydratase [Gammaproteobacteria bacterium]